MIDWETIGIRSFYYDFYFSMFMLAVNKTRFDSIDYEQLAILNNLLETSMASFYQELNKIEKQNQLKNISIQFDLYRYLFYIDLIVLTLRQKYKNEMSNFKELSTWVQRFKYIESLRME